MVDLSVSIVNWNGKGFIERCLDSLFAGRGSLSLELFVVDNASTDGSQALLRERYPNVTLIENQENRGYAVGNNQALAKSQGRYLLILNSDTMAQKDALTSMIQFMEAHPRIGALGPRLLNADGTFQPSASGHFPTLLDLFFDEVLFLSRIYNGFSRTAFGAKLLSRIQGVREPKEVVWIGGACMLIRREVLETVGGMDEHFFFYREDCDWCLRIRRAGWQVVYHPGCTFFHFWGRSSQQHLKKISLESRRSLLYFFRKHHGPIGFYTAKMILIIGLLFKWGLLFLGRRQEHRTFQQMISTLWLLKDPSQPLPC